MPIHLVLLFGIKALAATIAVGAVITVLTFAAILNWFREHAQLKEQDKQNVAFTLQQHLKNGNVKTVQGIFNTRNNTLLASKGYESGKIDPELAAVHRGEEVVLYE